MNVLHKLKLNIFYLIVIVYNSSFKVIFIFLYIINKSLVYILHTGQLQNGSSSNPLSNLVGSYNSDSEIEDDKKPKSNVLNDKVNDFLKVRTHSYMKL